MEDLSHQLIRVMVAEDIDILREDFCETINGEEDMEVIGDAATGAEITRLALERKPDIVLMDIEMEDLTSGITAAEHIHSKDPEIKIIFMTAHETDEMIHSGMGTGAVDYIIKGCDDAVLLEHIRRAYEGKTVLESNVQQSIIKEYNRLRKSEQSLVFFINNVSHLTHSEREIIRLLLEGKKVREIAEVRSVEIVTIKTQIKGLLHKFGCSRSKEIVELIHQLGLEKLFMQEKE
jgi:DNA-binding NarL/FixJ family response regulator